MASDKELSNCSIQSGTLGALTIRHSRFFCSMVKLKVLSPALTAETWYFTPSGVTVGLNVNAVALRRVWKLIVNVFMEMVKGAQIRTVAYCVRLSYCYASFC